MQRAIASIIDVTSKSWTGRYVETDNWIGFTKKLFGIGMANPAAYMIMEAYSTADMRESDFFLFLNEIVPASLADIRKP
jgi:hypothetical protein